MKEKAISELIADFISEQDVNSLSKKTYSLAIKKFVEWIVIDNIDFWKIKKKDLINYKSNLLSSRKSLYTVDLYLTVVRKLFRWMEERGIYDNIAMGIRSPRKDKKFRKGYLKIDQVNSLLSSIDLSTDIGKRDYAIISLMLRAGLRRIEICRMTIGDVMNDLMIIRLQRKGRTDKDCEMGLTSKMLDSIHDYLLCRNEFTEDSPLFVNHSLGYKNLAIRPELISRMIKNRLRCIGIDNKSMTCHSLRHTAAILALKAGASIYEVQQMLGHTSIDTTTIYLRAIDEETRLNNRAVRLLDEVLSDKTKRG